VAGNLPTVVFCPSIKYSHWAAKLWQDAGYTAQAISSETEDTERTLAIPNIREGKAQVTCNFGIYTKGTDVDIWACAVMLRPTNSPGLYSQMIGRVTRPHGSIAGMLGHIKSAEERRGLIARSEKPQCIILDVVDICGKHKVSTLPTVLGKARKIDMQGHSLLEVEKLVKEIEEKKVVIDYNCPVTFKQLEQRLEEIQILEGMDPKNRDRWIIGRDGGYSYGHSIPKYGAKLLREDGSWRLLVHHEGEIIYDKVGKNKGEIEAYFDTASQVALNQMKKHQRDNPPETKTLQLLTKNQIWRLKQAYTEQEISRMTIGWARMEVGRLVKESRSA
jgi:superfamily II DNA or RNA helicase